MVRPSRPPRRARRLSESPQSERGVSLMRALPAAAIRRTRRRETFGNEGAEGGEVRAAIAVLLAIAAAGLAAPASARAPVTGHSERLAARARQGDRVARAALVEEHMGLVRSIAVRYLGLGLPVEDLVQEGAIGLLTAV